MKFIRFIVIPLSLMCVTACASISTHIPVPQDSANIVQPVNMGDVRYWGDGVPADVEDRADETITAMRARLLSAPISTKPNEISVLALSGGGENGAYGAGLLSGWSDAGTRPEFQAVTGVSTGALIAPFAFLGSDYDDKLEAAYTQTDASNIYKRPLIPNFLWGRSLAKSRPLEEMIAAFITPDILAAIATEHQTGRRLSIVTTNLDAGRPVVWDMGAIAARGTPEAMSLFRQVMLASAAIPGLLPPVEIQVTEGGAIYTELHGDGSITSNVYAYPPQMQIRPYLDRAGIELDMKLYVIRNGKRDLAYDPPRMVWYDLTMRSVNLLLNASTDLQVQQIRTMAARDGLDFNLASMPDDYPDKSPKLFDQDYMRSLFAFARAQAAAGYNWASAPQKKVSP